ncbi:MAG: hypothetical protein V1716_01010 [Candidatus Uhrbacteria bacterium]
MIQCWVIFTVMKKNKKLDQKQPLNSQDYKTINKLTEEFCCELVQSQKEIKNLRVEFENKKSKSLVQKARKLIDSF